MKKFNYKSVDQFGKPFEGVLQANSPAEVVAMIRRNEQYVVGIEEIKQSLAPEINLFGGVSSTDMAVLTRQLYAMLNAGVPIVTCLDILRQQIEKKKLKEVIQHVYELVNKGYTLSEAFKQEATVFSELMIHMVAAGEASGQLDAIMERLAVHYEKETKIKNKIRGAMVYPIILGLVAIAVVIFMLTFILPQFITMFESSDVPLPMITKILIMVSKFVRAYWYLVIGGIGILVFSFRKYYYSERGRERIDTLRLKIPVIKSVTRKIYTARFSRTLSTLLASGIPLIEALENVEKVVGNVKVCESLKETREEVRRGATLSLPIKRYGMFPPMVSNMIEIGEESGTLDDMLNKTANFFDDEVDLAIQQLITMFEPALIIVMSIAVGFIVISIALPLFDMFQTI